MAEMKIIKRASLAADELYSFLCRKTPLNMQECCVRIRQLTDLKWARHHLKGAASYQRQSFREIYWAMRHLRFLLRICATFGILAPVSGLAHLLRKGWISRQPENIKVQGESTQPLRKIHTSVIFYIFRFGTYKAQMDKHRFQTTPPGDLPIFLKRLAVRVRPPCQRPSRQVRFHP